MKNHQKGFASILIILIVVAIVAGAGVYITTKKQKTNEQVTPNKTNTYTSDTFDFSINYPSTWHAYSDNNSTAKTQKISFGPADKEGYEWSINVNEKTYKSKDILLQQMKTLFVNQKVETTNITFNGIQAVKLQVSDSKASAVHIVFDGPKYTYDIYGKEDANFDAFYQSFELAK